MRWRREEEMASTTTSDKEIGQSPLSSTGCGGRACAALLLLLADDPHPLVVAPATNVMLLMGQDTGRDYA
jgi:hypothetical protein